MDNKGKIKVPGIYDHVAKLTDEEMKLYEKIEFDLEEYGKDVGADKLLHDTKVNPHCQCQLMYCNFVCLLIQVINLN